MVAKSSAIPSHLLGLMVRERPESVRKLCQSQPAWQALVKGALESSQMYMECRDRGSELWRYGFQSSGEVARFVHLFSRSVTGNAPMLLASRPTPAELGRIIEFADKYDLSQPAAITPPAESFDLVGLLTDLRFGFRSDNAVVKKLQRLAGQDAERVDAAAIDYVRELDEYISTVDRPDAADLEILALRNHVRRFINLGLTWIDEASYPEAPKKPWVRSPHIYFTTPERASKHGNSFAGIDAGYVIVVGDNYRLIKNEVVHLSDTPDISLVVERPRSFKEVARVATHVSVSGQYAPDKENPRFVSLIRKHFDETLFKQALPELENLLEYMVSVFPDYPETTDHPNQLPIAVEDTLLIAYFEKMVTLSKQVTYERVHRMAERMTPEHYRGANVAGRYDTLDEDVASIAEQAIFRRGTCLKNPETYAHFLYGLGNSVLAQQVHTALVEAHKMPQGYRKADLAQKKTRLRAALSTFPIEDDLDAEVAQAALETLESVEPRTYTRVFPTGSLSDFEAALDTAMKARRKGEPPGWVEGNKPRIVVTPYKQRLHHRVSTKISPAIRLYRISAR